MLELDAQDLALLDSLRHDSRLSLRDLGSRVGLSAPAVAARLKRLEESGIILGYTVQLCSDRFALAVEALILIKVPHLKQQAFVDFMAECLAVSSCLRLTGEFSHLVQAAFDNMGELDRFLCRLNAEYGATRTSLVLSHDIPERAVLNLRQLQAER